MTRTYRTIIKGQGKPVREDSYFENQKIGLFIVADGYSSGDAGGRVGSNTAANYLGLNLEADFLEKDPSSLSQDEIKAIIKKRVLEANERACEQTGKSTLSLLLTVGNSGYICNIGDSKIYGFNEEGKIAPLTEDHSLSQLRYDQYEPQQKKNHLLERLILQEENYGPCYFLGRKEFESAEISKMGLKSVRIEKTSFDKEIDQWIKVISIDEYASFLLATDGLTTRVAQQEIESNYQKYLSQEEMNSPQMFLDKLEDLINVPEKMLELLIENITSKDQIEEILRKYSLEEKDLAKPSNHLEAITIAQYQNKIHYYQDILKRATLINEELRTEISSQMKYDDTVLLFVDRKDRETSSLRQYDRLRNDYILLKTHQSDLEKIIKSNEEEIKELKENKKSLEAEKIGLEANLSKINADYLKITTELQDAKIQIHNLQDLTDDYNNSKEEILRLNERIAGLEEEKNGLISETETLTNNIEIINEKYTQLENSRLNLQEQLDLSENTRQRLKGNLENVETRIKAYFTNRFNNGHTLDLDQQKDPLDMLNEMMIRLSNLEESNHQLNERKAKADQQITQLEIELSQLRDEYLISKSEEKELHLQILESQNIRAEKDALRTEFTLIKNQLDHYYGETTNPIQPRDVTSSVTTLIERLLRLETEKTQREEEEEKKNKMIARAIDEQQTRNLEIQEKLKTEFTGFDNSDKKY